LPLPANTAGQSALVLDMVEFYFRGGERWAPRGNRVGERRGLFAAIRTLDEKRRNTADDVYPVEARVIDEALKILGLNGEKWIKGREADQQHNHCMIGAIKLARRRLKARGDTTKELVLKVLHREGQISHIPTFNDQGYRRFDQVREIMLLAKCDALRHIG
jgi:hypothetical protein